MDRKLYLGPLTDNRRWDHVTIRPDDIIVATPPKCGTTWMQTIVSLLLSADPDTDPDLSIKMPWVDIRVRDITEVAQRLAQMPHRRSMKSHTPMDGLPVTDQATYICVFRHPLDAHFSFRNHVRNVPIRIFDAWYPDPDPSGHTFRQFLDGGPEGFDMDLAPLAHMIRHYRAAKAVSDQPNVMMFHYADMTHDLSGVFQTLARALNISHPKPVMDRLIQAASFDNMKRNAHKYSPSGGKGFFKSDSAFFHSGSSGKWHGALTGDELEAYDRIMDAELSPQDRHWLEFGATQDHQT